MIAMKNLRNNRRDAGLTQYALARATGIRRWRISHAELGLLKLTSDESSLVSKILVEISRRKSARVENELGNSKKNVQRSGEA
jgi:predicted transcriptional regulator